MNDYIQNIFVSVANNMNMLVSAIDEYWWYDIDIIMNILIEHNVDLNRLLNILVIRYSHAKLSSNFNYFINVLLSHGIAPDDIIIDIIIENVVNTDGDSIITDIETTLDRIEHLSRWKQQEIGYLNLRINIDTGYLLQLQHRLELIWLLRYYRFVSNEQMNRLINVDDNYIREYIRTIIEYEEEQDVTLRHIMMEPLKRGDIYLEQYIQQFYKN